MKLSNWLGMVVAADSVAKGAGQHSSFQYVGMSEVENPCEIDPWLQVSVGRIAAGPAAQESPSMLQNSRLMF
jgi:hypothetical protein